LKRGLIHACGGRDGQGGVSTIIDRLFAADSWLLKAVWLACVELSTYR
jgi:hypothetical protein